MDIALIALCARPLAASAARAGFAALSLDLFADLDTCAHAARCVRVHKKNGFAFDADDLVKALTTLAPEGLPVVLGAGLEDDPALLARIAARNPILGNAPALVQALKDPLALAALCGHLNVPFPAVTLEAPGAAFGAGRPLIEKKIGGAGGSHIRRRAPSEGGPPAPGHYLQVEVPGESLSLLLVANGTGATAIGAVRQWHGGDETHPFRYGGAAGPVALPPAFARDMLRGATDLIRACGLVGLVSVDFVAGADGWFLVEVNPRPGATLDIFDVEPMPPLLGLHLAACGGRLPATLPMPAQAQAAEVLYADRDIVVPEIAWPEHVSDRPPAGALVAKDAPLCTVRASGATVEIAQVRLRDLAHEVRARFDLPEPAAP